VQGNVLDAAAKLFYERGYDNTTHELADVAGLTKSALYYYIPTRRGFSPSSASS
jgi:AcrR family transcriptional regulator